MISAEVRFFDAAGLVSGGEDGAAIATGSGFSPVIAANFEAGDQPVILNTGSIVPYWWFRALEESCTIGKDIFPCSLYCGIRDTSSFFPPQDDDVNVRMRPSSSTSRA